MQPDFEYHISTVSPQNTHKGMEVAQEPQGRKHHGMHPQRLSPMAWRFILILGDEVLLVTLLAAVLLTTPHLDLHLRASNYEINPWYLKILWGVLALMSWSIAVRITQAQELKSASNRLKSPLYVMFALVLMLIFWIALIYPIIISGVVYSRAMLFFLILAVPALSAWRVTLAEVISLPRFRRQAVIVGVNTAGDAIVRELRSAKRTSINVLGYISESSDERLQSEELPVLGGGSALRRMAQNGMIDMVIMAIDYNASPELFQEAIKAAQLGLSVVPITMVYENITCKIPVEQIGDQWYMTLSTEGIIPLLYLCWCKVIDFSFGLLGTVVLILVLPVLALLIYLDSPGPIFYKQERVGYQGRKFFMYKFRSMRTDAEQPGSAVWPTKADARVTRIGRFLRATHLDELPQVFNILRGEMRLIGPRPERPEYSSDLEKTSLFYRYRLAVKPGLTGWTQVQYGYGNASQDELVKLQYDLYYIKHRSFMLDISIILKTVVEVVLCHGQ
jgi:exopolysaccharide biosynthesis polyprenyl glycosylphosphotransferase